MNVSLTDAKAQLTDLVRRAEAGEEIVLPRHGQPAVRLTPVAQTLDWDAREAIMEEIMRSGREKALPGPSAARSQDSCMMRMACRREGDRHVGASRH